MSLPEGPEWMTIVPKTSDWLVKQSQALMYIRADAMTNKVTFFLELND
jgi:hypothetical protein